MTKWVSVKDTKNTPYHHTKKKRPVIVTDGVTVTIAWYDSALKSYLQDISFKDITESVTWWQYLPNAFPFPEKTHKAKAKNISNNIESMNEENKD